MKYLCNFKVQEGILVKQFGDFSLILNYLG